MNYEKHYENLILKAKNRKLEGYCEIHHILPKCLGGNNKKENLIKLTAREHFIAHLLLIKIYPKNYSLIKALNMMCLSNDSMVRKNRMYGWLREKFSKEMSRSQLGQNNSQFNTCWVYHLSLKVSFKISKINLYEYLLDGFYKGRVFDFSKEIKLKKVKLPKLLKVKKTKEEISKTISNSLKISKKYKEFQEKRKEEYLNKDFSKESNYYNELFFNFNTGKYSSLRDFYNNNDFNFTLMTLSNNFRKYVIEYKEKSKARKKFKNIGS